MLNSIKSHDSNNQSNDSINDLAENKYEQQKITEIIKRASQIITPSWPLHSFVAVNPFYNLRDELSYHAFSKLSLISGKNLFLPMEVFLEKHNSGEITNSHISKAIKSLIEVGITLDYDIDTFIKESRKESKLEQSFQTYSDFISEKEKCNLTNIFIEQISKYCSSYYDQGQAAFSLRESKERLFSQWIDIIGLDASLKYLGYFSKFSFTPYANKDPLEVIHKCAITLGLLNDSSLEVYLMKVCYHLIGWCGHVSYQNWQESLGLTSRGKGTKVEDLLAMYMLYECYVKQRYSQHDIEWYGLLDTQLGNFHRSIKTLNPRLKRLCAWQRAYEWSFQDHISESIQMNGFIEDTTNTEKKVQMIFCIDVRSEILRRNIEKVSSQISTHGFAGFFGVGLNCQHQNYEDATYRCPVLLQPTINILEKFSESDSRVRKGALSLERFFSGLKQGLTSSFLYVEFFGFMSGFKIIKQALGIRESKPSLFKKKFNDSSTLENGLDLDRKVSIATFTLTHLGIRNFSDTVIVCGHGSVTSNNAYASSLDCGACGGHAGDLNARVICEILNNADVRSELSRQGKFQIPKETYFIPAIHETISQEIIILEKESIPSSHKEILQNLENTLTLASQNSQNEREKLSQANIGHDCIKRIENWAEVRPEWALARNACFIIAPRERTLRLNLEGRSFLHDYDWHIDDEMKTLELIMTAPMLVTNWINMQYYASSVCMDTYGSGNKVIHNIVGSFGVCEGNGGDLRIGLPFQSVHDGTKLIHEPLRLSVFIEAPQKEIEKIIAKHPTVRELIDNAWLHIFCIDSMEGSVSYRHNSCRYEVLGSH